MTSIKSDKTYHSTERPFGNIQINLEFRSLIRTFAAMETKTIVTNTTKIVFPILLGGVILYWMYRGEDFTRLQHVLTDEMNWAWMLLSFPFGILAQMFRGWRWRQTLEPLGEHPRTSTSLYAVFLSYAVSLVIPRIGEFTRCGILKRYDGISFSKALGTVVTERAIDTLLIGGITGLTLLFQLSVFGTFFDQTGTSLDSILHNFSLTGYLVTVVCIVAILILLHILLRSLNIYSKVKATAGGIWGSYFLHYYLTFFCFDFTEHLGLACAMVTFVVGSIAVIVPTPNGAGPWHFAVKTMLILYGVVDEHALYFVLIVHTVQTMLVVALGIYAWAALSFTKRITLKTT